LKGIEIVAVIEAAIIVLSHTLDRR